MASQLPFKQKFKTSKTLKSTFFLCWKWVCHSMLLLWGSFLRNCPLEQLWHNGVRSFYQRKKEIEVLRFFLEKMKMILNNMKFIIYSIHREMRLKINSFMSVLKKTWRKEPSERLRK